MAIGPAPEIIDVTASANAESVAIIRGVPPTGFSKGLAISEDFARAS